MSHGASFRSLVASARDTTSLDRSLSAHEPMRSGWAALANPENLAAIQGLAANPSNLAAIQAAAQNSGNLAAIQNATPNPLSNAMQPAANSNPPTGAWAPQGAFAPGTVPAFPTQTLPQNALPYAPPPNYPPAALPEAVPPSLPGSADGEGPLPPPAGPGADPLVDSESPGNVGNGEAPLPDARYPAEMLEALALPGVEWQAKAAFILGDSVRRALETVALRDVRATQRPKRRPRKTAPPATKPVITKEEAGIALLLSIFFLVITFRKGCECCPGCGMPETLYTCCGKEGIDASGNKYRMDAEACGGMVTSCPDGSRPYFSPCCNQTVCNINRTSCEGCSICDAPATA